MSRRNLVIGFVAVLAVLAGAVWFFFLRGDAPPPASIEDAVASVTSTTAVAESGATTTTPATTIPAREGLDGSWGVDPDVSFVGYRIDEELASVGAITAVGRTSQLSAELEFEGLEVTSLSVTVDMTTLESDQSRRDSAMNSRGLETDSFPNASFSLTSPIELGSTPSEGETFTASAVGELTLHGVTQPISLDIEGSLVEGKVVIVGSVEIALADYAIEKPTGFSVISIADVGVLEIQLAFVPA